jgi:hypothetical protein
VSDEKLGRSLFTTAVDHFLDPASQGQIAIFIEEAFVAGTEPAIDKSLGISFIIAFIAFEDFLATDHNFPLVSRLQNRAIGSQNRHGVAEWDTNCTAPVGCRWNRI